MQPRSRAPEGRWVVLAVALLVLTATLLFEHLSAVRAGSTARRAVRALGSDSALRPERPKDRRRRLIEVLGSSLLAEAGGDARRAALAAAAQKGDLRRTRLSAVIEQWARSDPNGAWKWVIAHESTKASEGETSQVIPLLEAIASEDTSLIASFVATVNQAALPQSDRRAANYAAMVALVTTGRLEAARIMLEDWLAVPDQPAVDVSAVTLVASAMLQAGPPANAAAWLERMPGSERFVESAARIGAIWAQSDPLSAIAWAGTIQGEDARSSTIESVFAVWADHDPEAAGRWYLEHMGQSRMDRLAPIFVRQSGIDRTMPAAAAQWIGLSGGE